ncbi:MAG: hypothetical protein ACXW1S_03070 [Acidimicrobiia bacterium]
MVDPSPPSRPERAIAAARRRGAAAWLHVRSALRNPVRLLIGAMVVVLVVLAVPLLVGSAIRLERIWSDWRHDATVTNDWTPATASIRGVRTSDGLDLDLAYWDRDGDRHRADVHIDSPGREWIRSTLPIRYDPDRPSEVELVGVTNGHPLGQALATGATLGAGIAAALLAHNIWRRRSVLACTDRPMRALRTPLALSGAVLTIGIAAWGVGTVTARGWTSIADGIGGQATDLFGDFMIVIIPAVAFGAGALASAWLSQHRHHERHDGMLSSAHRLIDRASDYMPSPEQFRAETDQAPASEPERGARTDTGSGGSPHAA